MDLTLIVAGAVLYGWVGGWIWGAIWWQVRGKNVPLLASVIMAVSTVLFWPVDLVMALALARMEKKKSDGAEKSIRDQERFFDRIPKQVEEMGHERKQQAMNERLH